MEGIDYFVQLYNKYSDNEVNVDGIKVIYPKIQMILNKIELDEIDTFDLIDTLILFNKNGLLEQINEKTLSLLSKILGNENNSFCEEDKIEFLQYMKFLLLPFNLNNCLDERLLSSYLASFDNFLNRMVLLKVNDLLVIKEYNKELFEVVSRCKYIVDNYQKSGLLHQYSTLDNMIIDNTLLHLATLLYLNLNEFDYNYDLLVEVFNKIMNDYVDFAFICSINGIYKDITNFNPDSENIIAEYLFCKNMLEYEYKSPIKVKKCR